MKKVIIIFCLWVTVMYLLGSFIALDFNPAKWSSDSRVIGGSITLIFGFGFSLMSYNINNGIEWMSKEDHEAILINKIKH